MKLPGKKTEYPAKRIMIATMNIVIQATYGWKGDLYGSAGMFVSSKWWDFWRNYLHSREMFCFLRA